MAGNNQGRNKAANPAEQSVDTAQREQAMKFMQMLAGKSQYVPILKALKEIGVKPRKMAVMIGDEPMDCIVIPEQELMSKEWAHMCDNDNEEQKA